MLLLLLSCTRPAVSAGNGVPPSQAPDGFWDHWGDGRAELAGYTLVQPRYGELRQGEAVLVTVTETFTRAQRVKSDGGHSDEYPVIKLNEVHDFPTGIYDYNVMTSSFVALDGSEPWGIPTKISHSMQEWCGHVWEQWTQQDSNLARVSHSYFDGEADQAGTLPKPVGGIVLDALALYARNLTGEVFVPGKKVTLPVLPRAQEFRFAHKAPAWTEGVFFRAAKTMQLEVPAGTFEVRQLDLSVEGWPDRTWWFEEAAPHRLVAWSTTEGERGELTGAVRTKYWQQNGTADVGARAQLNLPSDQ